jgi:hypothetical protein
VSLVPYEDTAVPTLPERVTLEQSLRLWEDTARFAAHLAPTEFVPKDLRNKPAAIAAAMLRANELGISPMEGLAKIHVINGRPGLAAELMRALVQRAGHEIWTEEHTQTRVTVCGQRRGSEHVEKVTWTADDVKRAGLAGDGHKKYPRAMLFARATAELCRMQFADVLAGMSYAIEELVDLEPDDLLPDEIIDVNGAEVPAEPKMQTRKAAGTARKAQPRKRAGATAPPPGASELPPLPGEADVPPVVPPVDESPDKVVEARAKSIAISAGKAGVDHHQVVAAVTNGEKTSAKAVTPEEGTQVLQALGAIQRGELWLDDSVDPPRLVTEQPAESSSEGGGSKEPVESVPPVAPPSDDVLDSLPDVAGEWTPDQWRMLLADRGVKAMDVVVEAQRWAAANGEPPPASLDELYGRDVLCEHLVGFVEETAAKAAGQ